MIQFHRVTSMNDQIKKQEAFLLCLERTSLSAIRLRFQRLLLFWRSRLTCFGEQVSKFPLLSAGRSSLVCRAAEAMRRKQIGPASAGDCFTTKFLCSLLVVETHASAALAEYGRLIFWLDNTFCLSTVNVEEGEIPCFIFFSVILLQRCVFLPSFDLAFVRSFFSSNIAQPHGIPITATAIPDSMQFECYLVSLQT